MNPMSVFINTQDKQSRQILYNYFMLYVFFVTRYVYVILPTRYVLSFIVYVTLRYVRDSNARTHVTRTGDGVSSDGVKDAETELSFFLHYRNFEWGTSSPRGSSCASNKLNLVYAHLPPFRRRSVHALPQPQSPSGLVGCHSAMATAQLRC